MSATHDNTPLRMPTDEEIVRAYREIERRRLITLPDYWNGIPDLENQIMPLAMEHTKATLDYGRISSEPHRCGKCSRLLRPHQFRMGICAGCQTDEE